MKHVLTLGFCLMTVIASQSALAAKVYTWTDKNGLTHYGEHPPKDTKAKLVNARTGHSDPIPPVPQAPTAETPKPVATTDANATAKDPEICATAKKNLDSLNGYARVRMQDDKGEFRYLTEEEKQKYKTDATIQVKEHCQ